MEVQIFCYPKRCYVLIKARGTREKRCCFEQEEVCSGLDGDENPLLSSYRERVVRPEGFLFFSSPGRYINHLITTPPTALSFLLSYTSTDSVFGLMLWSLLTPPSSKLTQFKVRTAVKLQLGPSSLKSWLRFFSLIVQYVLHARLVQVQWPGLAKLSSGRKQNAGPQRFLLQRKKILLFFRAGLRLKDSFSFPVILRKLLHQIMEIFLPPLCR